MVAAGFSSEESSMCSNVCLSACLAKVCLEQTYYWWASSRPQADFIYDRYSSKCFSRHFICKFWIRQSEPKYFVLLVAGVDDRQSCTVRWGWQMRLVWPEWGQSHPGSVDTRGIKYQDITTKMALATQRVMLNEKYETGSHFPFSSNISESVSWLARSEQCFPSFIFSVKNRERRGCLAAEGDRRDEPSQSAQYKLAKSTQTLTLHPLLSSLETHGKRPYSVEGRKGNWTLDIVLLMWK